MGKRWLALGWVLGLGCAPDEVEQGTTDAATTSEDGTTAAEADGSTGEASSGDAGSSTGEGDDGSGGGGSTGDSTGGTEGDGSSTGVVQLCGNGVVEGDEACDDGNDVYGDGCSACEISGTVIWSTSTDAAVYPQRIAIGEDGRILVTTGTAGTTLPHSVGAVQVFDPDGAHLDSVVFPAPNQFADTLTYDVCTGSADRFYTASEVQDNPPSRSLRAYDGVELAWSRELTSPLETTAWTHCVVVDGDVVVGGRDFDGAGNPAELLLARYNADGDQQWSQLMPDTLVFSMVRGPNAETVLSIATAANVLQLIGFDADGNLLFARDYPEFPPGYVMGDESSLYFVAKWGGQPTYVGKFQDGGDIDWSYEVTPDLPPNHTALATGFAVGPNETVVVSGRTVDSPLFQWRGVYDEDGEVGWQFYEPDDGSTWFYTNALAIDEDNHLIVAIWDYADDTSLTTVRKEVL